MDKKNRIDQMNKKLKIYINESSFISQKCRNQLLKIFAEEFDVHLDIDTYKNVDLSIQEDFKFLYRDDTYESKSSISSMEELEERYQRFQERADSLIHRKNVDFQGRRNLNNFTNLVLIVCIILLMIALVIVGISSFLSGNYYDCIFFLVVIVPWIVPKLKTNLMERMRQAKQYIKSLLKKVK